MECKIFAEPIITFDYTPIDLDNPEFFQECSWTITYKPTEGAWNSYFSFYPDYYVSHEQHFQQGNNYGIDKGKMWSHWLGNASFQVFNGRLHPFIVEYPIVNENAHKILNSITLDVEAKRWQSQWDYAVYKGIGFNKLQIFNSTNNSGVLNLVEQKNYQDGRNYPKVESDGTQSILFSSIDGTHIVNYFYNRVKSQDNGIPQFLWDRNMIEKTTNPRAVSFFGKRQLETLKGDWFTIRLQQDKESRFEISLNKSTNLENVYQ